jgi:hypothetical protein
MLQPRSATSIARVAALMVLLVMVTACTPAPAVPSKALAVTYARVGDQAFTHMIKDFYTHGQWKSCASCGAGNQDWGDDAMTYTLWLRWEVHHHDASVIPALQALATTAPAYGPPCKHGNACGQWSDIPMWDSIALGREYEATGAKSATFLAKEKAAFRTVDGAGASVYAFGACPLIHYHSRRWRRTPTTSRRHCCSIATRMTHLTSPRPRANTPPPVATSSTAISPSTRSRSLITAPRVARYAGASTPRSTAT